MNRQSEEFLRCPYCGESISMLIDHSAAEQRYVEDCEVCCRPVDVECRIDAEGNLEVIARRSDE